MHLSPVDPMVTPREKFNAFLTQSISPHALFPPVAFDSLTRKSGGPLFSARKNSRHKGVRNVYAQNPPVSAHCQGRRQKSRTGTNAAKKAEQERTLLYINDARLDVVRLRGVPAPEHVVEAREDVFREMDALAGLAHASHRDGAHAVEHIGVAVVEPDLLFGFGHARGESNTTHVKRTKKKNTHFF